MKGSAAKVLCVSLILVTLATLAFALAKRPVRNTARGKGLPTDWSHRHLIFSQPRTAGQAARSQNNTRYLQQQRRRTGRTMQPVNLQYPRETTLPAVHKHKEDKRRGRRMHRDWAMDLGPGAKLGPNVYPAKYSFSTTIANCAFGLPSPDFVIYPTGLLGSSSQASVVSYTNLYSGCSGLGPVPAGYWAYNTGGTVNTSPVSSLEGTQVALTQTSGGTSSLVLLTWLAFDGFVQTPNTLTPVAASSYFGCTSPCMTTLPLGATDSSSSVFYDYDTDMAYVGDDSGKLHKFSPVFSGTPAEVVTGGWPVQVSSSVLTSPLYDSASGNAFVADAAGFLYSVGGTGTLTKSGQLGFGLGIVDSPMLDVTAGVVYVYAADDSGGSAGVFQLPTTFAASATGTEAKIGTGAASSPVYDGDFDYGYLTSSDFTGNIYVCGNPGAEPTLYQVPLLSGTMGAARSVSVVSTTSGAVCSPLTDVYNPTINGEGTPTEWVFLSTEAAGSPAPCQGVSCVMNFKTTSWLPSTVYNLGQQVLDSNLNIQVAYNSGGRSGTTPPTWNKTVFGPTCDPVGCPAGSVIWRMQGSLQPPFPTAWATNTSYPGGSEIFDSNNNIEVSELGGGTSGGTQPTWPVGVGAITSDGTVTWINLGLNPVAALNESGGTSGIIIDNTVDSAGSSQVYFSTLQDQGCFTSGGTGGCAVQASQQGLQ
jgi:hypothetical protein